MKLIEFQDLLNSEEMRRESWRRKFETDKTLRSAKPNEGHYAIQRLISSGKASAVITQNIDNLHQDSGIAPGSGKLYKRRSASINYFPNIPMPNTIRSLLSFQDPRLSIF